jgi:hypothetical protein
MIICLTLNQKHQKQLHYFSRLAEGKTRPWSNTRQRPVEQCTYITRHKISDISQFVTGVGSSTGPVFTMFPVSLPVVLTYCFFIQPTGCSNLLVLHSAYRLFETGISLSSETQTQSSSFQLVTTAFQILILCLWPFFQLIRNIQTKQRR